MYTNLVNVYYTCKKEEEKKLMYTRLDHIKKTVLKMRLLNVVFTSDTITNVE